MNNDGIITQGNGWRIRELIDGRYVAEVYRRYGWRKRWLGIAIRANQDCDAGAWVLADDKDHRLCIGTHQQCITALAENGIGRNLEKRA